MCGGGGGVGGTMVYCSGILLLVQLLIQYFCLSCSVVCLVAEKAYMLEC